MRKIIIFLILALLIPCVAFAHGPPPFTLMPSDTAYNATTWNGNVDSATKNVVRDEFELKLDINGAGSSLTAVCLESVFGATIGTGLVKDSTVLKASTILQKYHGVDPSANILSLLGSADYSTARTNLGIGTGDSPSFTAMSTSGATPLLLTNGQLVNIALTSQTSGATTLTIPDFTGVADEFTFKTKSQTLSNKTFVAPVLGAATATSVTLDPSATPSWTFSDSDGADTVKDAAKILVNMTTTSAQDEISDVSIQSMMDDDGTPGATDDDDSALVNVIEWDGSAETLTFGDSVTGEDLTIALGVANVATIGTNSGVTTVDFGSIIVSAPVAFDEHVEAATDTLTAAQLSRGFINNYGQEAGATATLTLPAAAEGLTFVAIIGQATTGSKIYKFLRAGSDDIYWDDGTIATCTYFQATDQAVGSRVSCATFQTGAAPDYDWICGPLYGTWATD